MSEKPIIFSGPMVRAILDGHKTETRRVLKPQPTGIAKAVHVGAGIWALTPESNRCSVDFKAPPYAPGDLLWVREAFSPAPMEAPPDPPRPTQWMIAYAAGGQAEVTARANYNPLLYNYERWSPSIHMPREFSRITLRVTDVRVQRLQDISEEDAAAEGLWRGKARKHLFWHNASACRLVEGRRHTDVFAELWDSINAARGHGWESNPWVCAITFERQESANERD